jgi:hypothetical protein
MVAVMFRAVKEGAQQLALMVVVRVVRVVVPVVRAISRELHLKAQKTT